MRFATLLWCLGALAGGAPSLGAADWRDAANLTTIGATLPADGKPAGAVEQEAILRGYGQPGGLFYPGEPVSISLAAVAKPTRSLEGAVIESVAIDNRIAQPGDTGFVEEREAVHFRRTPGQAVVKTPLADAKAGDGELLVTLQLPDTYGAYALVLRRADGSGTALGTVARVHRPTPRKSDQPQCMAFAFDPAIMQRLGIGLVRYESHWNQAAAGAPYNFANQDVAINGYEAAGIKVLNTVGIHPAWSKPFVAMAPDGRAVGGLGGACSEAHEQDFANWVTAFCTRYYHGGKAGLWGIDHYNEPWEPRGISGWCSDSERYRALLRIIHRSAKAVDPGIRMCGTSSVMNTEDKLLSDGDPADVQLLDVLTDHYVGPSASYGPRLAAKYGKISGETETWGASTEMLHHQFMMEFLAIGNAFVSPQTESMLFEAYPGRGRTRLLTPKPTVVAVSTWNALVQDRPFKRLAFTTSLPFLYQFGEDADAQFVLTGKLYNGVALDPRMSVWAQSAAAGDGTLTIADPGHALIVQDAAGNPMAADAAGNYTLIMSLQAWFLRSSQGAGAVIEAVRSARQEGMRRVEIIPGTLPAIPSAGSPVALPVRLHNLGCRALDGQLTVRSLDASAPLTARVAAAVGAGATITVRVPVEAMGTGGLPLAFAFAADGREDTWQEVVPCTGIPHRTMSGPEDAGWEAVPPVVVLRPEGKVADNAIEKAWLPFLAHAQDAVPARRAEAKLTWDSQRLYLRLSIDGKPMAPRARLATRHDADCFYGAADDALCALFVPYERFLGQLIVPANARKEVKDASIAARKDPAWPAFEALLASHPEASDAIRFGWLQAWLQVRKIRPDASLAEAANVYKPGRSFISDLPFSRDGVQLAFDTDPVANRFTSTHDLVYPPGILPDGYVEVPDTDAEFAVYPCDDGAPEVWCLLAPGMPRNHYYPHQRRGAVAQHPVADASPAIVRPGERTVIYLALPWTAIGLERPAAGSDFGFAFRFNSPAGGDPEFGADLAQTKSNNLTMHPYWRTAASCSVRWVLLP